MNLHGKDIKIFTANSNPKVAAEIAQQLGLPMGESEVVTFSDGEISVSIKESIRGSDVFVVQSLNLDGTPVEVPSLLDAGEETKETVIRREISDFAKNSPDIVAQLLKNWMKDEGEE